MNLSEFIFSFHLIRPWVLLLFPIICALWWFARRSLVGTATLQDGLAGHLRKALFLHESGARRITPLDTVATGLLVLSIAASGPSWSRVPAPFAAQTAPIVIALEVSDSMLAEDMAPSRLERAKQKIHDLLELRAGARTALIAYAGTAHQVVPMTEDSALMQPYLEGLSPDIMPQQGEVASAAYALATNLLALESAPGGVLFVVDSLDPSDLPVFQDGPGPTTAFLTMLPAGDSDAVLSQLPGEQVIPATIDSRDLNNVERRLNTAYRRALLENSDQPWEDQGRLFVWPVLLIVLYWFRRGWTMHWAMLLCLGIVLYPSQKAHADGVADWFFTADQQGRIAYHNLEFTEAADLFVDPMWKGYMLYRDGQYQEAALVLDRLDTADASFAKGMSYIKGQLYRDGVRAFEETLELDPNYPNAEQNLRVAQEIVEYIERVREESDTGEEGGIGADEVVYDEDAERGVETEIQAANENGEATLLTTDQWMNTVDTRTSDFLRQRFALEAARRQ